MTADEFQARHLARYRRVFMRLLPVADALVEADADWHERQATVKADLARAASRAAGRGPVPPHLFAPPCVLVSPRRQMDVPDEPGTVGADFEGCES